MRILITGGSGFVGAQLAFYFGRRRHKVTVMDNLVRRGSELNLPLFQREGVAFVHGDVRNREDFMNLESTFDVVVDVSAQPSLIYGYANPVFDLTNNTFGLVNALEFARSRGCPVIFFSTNRVYSADRINALPRREEATRFSWDAAAWAQAAGARPAGFDPAHGVSEDFSVDGGQHSIYGLSKIMADLACQEYADAFGVPIVINRCGVLSGEGQFGKSEQGWASWWAVAHHFNLPLRLIGWNGGKQVRDLLFIDDICRLVEREIEMMDRIGGEVFNIGGGLPQSISMLETTQLMREKFGHGVTVAVEAEPRKADQCIYASDTRKAQRVLGWAPRIGLDEGFDRIIAWVRENEEALRGIYCVAPQAMAAK
ncbi:MAG TPA: NAD-dependent epimerase/dehydratase family protein [Candidatus Solibacter sp.]|nr:NAD-dependent epimerase/dehydratase family protein [Candidatus Solibacter sp.]